MPTRPNATDLMPLTALAEEIDVDASTAGRIVRRLGMRQYADPLDRRKKLFSRREFVRLSQMSPSADTHPTIVESPFHTLPQSSGLGWFEAAGGFASPAVRFERSVLSPRPDSVDLPEVGSDSSEDVGIMWDYVPRG